MMTSFNAQNDAAPAFSRVSKVDFPMSDIASVDIVFTSDKSKWTRAMVLEMCPDEILSEGGVKRFSSRSGQSVDKDGNYSEAGSGSSSDPNDPNYIGETGMGWFPGYAINLETGERLNIMYGENSYLVGENGRDMMFNPTANQYDFLGTPLFGGMHYVYIMDHTTRATTSDPNTYIFPAYDACLQYNTLFDTLSAHVLWEVRYQSMLYSTAMWVGMPLAVEGEEWLPDGNDWKLSIRMAKPYKRYFSLPFAPEYASGDTTDMDWPTYSFKTEEVATTLNNASKAETDLDYIKVVPNPYYAYASYENNALDNRIKITNVPEQVTVTIYNINGTLVRQLTKDSDETYIDWDLKNFAGVPIAGGIYIIHVKTNAGERVLKWFGILRPPDLNTF
jgi:hypothetical protein